MDPKELLKKVRRIHIRTSHVANDLFAGHYHSAFKGHGMEFEEVREYQPGDEIRRIDWNVTARQGKPFVKRFREERELTVMLVVDVSGSQDFGSAGQLKRELAAEVGATLAFSAIKNNDKVGLIAFSDRIERYVKPDKGLRHVLRVIRELLAIQATGKGTDIAGALDYLSRVSTRRAVVFLISDFQAAHYDRQFRVAKRRHDLIPIAITDPREAALPDVGLIELEEAETGARYVLDTGSATVRDAFAARAAAARTARDRMLRSCGVDTIGIATDRPYTQALLRFFRMRERRQ